MTGFAQLLRAVRAEGVRLGGRRGPLAFAALPGAVLAPLIVTFVIAAVARDAGLTQRLRDYR